MLKQLSVAVCVPKILIHVYDGICTHMYMLPVLPPGNFNTILIILHDSKLQNRTTFEISVSKCQLIVINLEISIFEKVYEHTVVQM
jgi:hypothetical protein